MILFILCDAFFGLIYKKVFLKNFSTLLFFKSTFIDKDDSNSAVTFPCIALQPEGEKYWGEAQTWLTLMKRFTNLKVNLKRLGLYIGAKMQLVSYEFEYFYQCIMTYWGLSEFKKPISRHQAHLVQT